MIHSGVIGGGHFYLYYKEETDNGPQWFQANDAYIGKISTEEAFEIGWGT